jgi:hypothetical protein
VSRSTYVHYPAYCRLKLDIACVREADILQILAEILHTPQSIRDPQILQMSSEPSILASSGRQFDARVELASSRDLPIMLLAHQDQIFLFDLQVQNAVDMAS